MFTSLRSGAFPLSTTVPLMVPPPAAAAKPGAAHRVKSNAASMRVMEPPGKSSWWRPIKGESGSQCNGAVLPTLGRPMTDRASASTLCPRRTPLRCSRLGRRPELLSFAPMAAFVPDRAKFLELAQKGRLCFVYREWLADSETPVSVYAKLGRGPYSFLLESVVGGEKWAAYSFAGVRPRSVIRARGEEVEILRPEGDQFAVVERRREPDPVAFVNRAVRELSPAVPPGLPRFFGGAVGWLGYDAVRRFERLPSRAPDELGVPDLCFALTDTVVVFDNLRGTIKVVAACDVASGDPSRIYDDA